MRGDNDLKAAVIAFVLALQAMVDCLVLRVPDSIIPIVVIVVVSGVWWKVLKALEKRDRKRRRRRSEVHIYNLKAENEWPMIEVR